MTRRSVARQTGAMPKKRSIPDTEAVMEKVRAAFAESGFTLDELGVRMGYERSARKSVWQFLYQSHDPRLSMLLRFAAAVDLNPKTLL